MWRMSQDSEKDNSCREPGAVKLTKCVRIRNFECENPLEHPPLLPPQNWLNCFNVTSQTRQALNKTSDWESADTSHVLLDIDLPNQQLYHLPLLITPVHCIYLITFDLRNHQESLARIHNAMKNVYALTLKAGGPEESPPRVLLVGMHANAELADKRSFAEKLRKLLQKMPYNRLVYKPDKPDCDEPFWAVEGGDLCLSGTDSLSCAIQSSCSWHEGEVRQWIKCHRELQEKHKDPCILYSNLQKQVVGKASGVEMSRFDEFLQFLHGYGFIYYHSGEEGQDADRVVLLQPDYLCRLFAEVPKLRKSRRRPTVADLMSSTAAYMEASAKHKPWFQRICIDMGLVFEVVNEMNSISDYVFLMGLEPGPSSPSRKLYSIPPLLVTFKALGHDEQEEEHLLPSYFFAAFVTEFVRILTEYNSQQNKANRQQNLLQVLCMEQHYLQVRILNSYIHVVEREVCIEIGLQQVEVPGRRPTDKKKLRSIMEKKMQKLQSMCKDMRGVVVGSVERLQERLKLALAISYGFYHSRNADDCSDAFAEFVQGDEGPYLRCCCCKPPDHATAPEQEIWFEEDFSFDEVSIATVTSPSVGLVRQLVKQPNDSEVPRNPSPLVAPVPTTEEPKKVEPGLSASTVTEKANVSSEKVSDSSLTTASTVAEKENILSQKVSDHPDHLILFRKFVSRKAAGRERPVLEGVGLGANDITTFINSHPNKIEDAVQEGLVKWSDGRCRKPPTWQVLLEAMDYAEIANEHVQSLKKELGLEK